MFSADSCRFLNDFSRLLGLYVSLTVHVSPEKVVSVRLIAYKRWFRLHNALGSRFLMSHCVESDRRKSRQVRAELRLQRCPSNQPPADAIRCITRLLQCALHCHWIDMICVKFCMEWFGRSFVDMKG